MGKTYDNIDEKCIIVGLETGEIKGDIGAGSTLRETTKNERKAIRDKKRRNICIRGNIDSMGEYTVHYRHGYGLLKDISLDTTGALLILSHFIIQNKRKDGFILIGTQGGGYIKPFKTKKDIMDRLNYSNKKTAYKIINEAIKANLLRHTNEGYRLNENLFFRGSADKYSFIVSFKRSIMELKEMLPLKSIGYLFRMSEFLSGCSSLHDFTLVSNPEEMTPENVRYLTVNELSERLSVSERTVIRLSDINIQFKGFERYGQIPLMIKSGHMRAKNESQWLTLNPLLFTNRLDEAIEHGLIKFIQGSNNNYD